MGKTKDSYSKESIPDCIKGEMVKSRKKISLLTEDFASEPFWRNIIEFAKPELKGKIFIPYPKAYKFPDKKGKEVSAMGKNHLENFAEIVDKEIIVCCDADNDYLYDESVWFYNKPYIFHTYTHSIENHKCYPQILSDICENITSISFDFEPYFEWYSEEIYPILVYKLFFENKENDIKNSFYEKCCELERLLDWNEAEKIINDSYEQIKMNLAWKFLCPLIDEVKQNRENTNYLRMPNVTTNPSEKHFRNEIRSLVINLENKLKEIGEFDFIISHFGFSEFKENFDKKNLHKVTIFYLQGHAVFATVKPFLDEVINAKIEERKILLENTDYLENEVNQFKNSAKEKSIHTLLDDSYQKCFQNPNVCGFMNFIIQDIKKYLA